MQLLETCWDINIAAYTAGLLINRLRLSSYDANIDLTQFGVQGLAAAA